MAIQLHDDFKDFLKLLNSHRVKYLLVGGYAVSAYGYVRFTGDMDIWIAIEPENTELAVSAIREFGFDTPENRAETLQLKNSMFRLGEQPDRIEVITTLSGVEFDECYSKRYEVILDGIPVQMISLEDLKKINSQQVVLKTSTTLNTSIRFRIETKPY